MFGKDPFDDPGLNTHRHELAGSDLDGNGDMAAGWIGWLFVIFLAVAPLILPTVILNQLWPNCPLPIANSIVFAGYLAIIYAFTRFRIFGGLPVVGSGILLILSALMSIFSRKTKAAFTKQLASRLYLLFWGFL